MPFVRGFLRIRRAGRPGQPLPPGEEGPVDPDYGIDEGELPEVEPPDPPPGIWPPPVPAHPIQPVPPGDPSEPGAIWPPPGGLGKPMPKPPAQPGQPLPKNYLLVLAKIPGYGWKYIVVDVNAIMGRYPDQGLPGGIPPREPK